MKKAEKDILGAVGILGEWFGGENSVIGDIGKKAREVVQKDEPPKKEDNVIDLLPCEKCGTMSTQKLCPTCQEKPTEPARPATAPTPVFCGDCGSKNLGSRFCRDCGAKRSH